MWKHIGIIYWVDFIKWNNLPLFKNMKGFPKRLSESI